MGTCYSRQGHIVPPADNMPHPTSNGCQVTRPTEQAVAEPVKQSGFGFKKPYGGRYAQAKVTHENIEPPKSEDLSRKSVGSTDSLKKTSSNNSVKQGGGLGSRFGFKATNSNSKAGKQRDSSLNQNTLASSNDSILSTASSKLSKRNSGNKRGSAYAPTTSSGSWRMIDDSSSVFSKSSDEKILEDTRKSEPILNKDDITNANNLLGCGKLLGPGTKKAPIAGMESLDTLSVGSHDNVTLQKGMSSLPATKAKPQSRLRGPLVKNPNQNVSISQKDVSDGNMGRAAAERSKSNQINSSTQKDLGKGSKTGGSFLKRSFLSKQKPVSEDRSKSSPKAQAKSNMSDSRATPEPPKLKQNSGSKDSLREHKVTAQNAPSVTPSVSVTGNAHVTSPPAGATAPIPKVPIAMIESLETMSLGSIHSDDLMLDEDFPMEDYEELTEPKDSKRASPLKERPSQKFRSGRPRSRSGSRSQEKSVRSSDRPTSLPLSSQNTPARCSPMAESNTVLMETSRSRMESSVGPVETSVSTSPQHHKIEGKGRYHSDSRGKHQVSLRSQSSIQEAQPEEPLGELATLIEDTNPIHRWVKQYQKFVHIIFFIYVLYPYL